MLDIQLLGQFCVRVDGTMALLPSRPAQSLLARLALAPGVSYRREKLAGELWPEATEANARSNLRHALWRIRAVLARNSRDGLGRGRAVIQTDNIAIGLARDAEARIDALELARVAHDQGASTADLAAAAALYRGELLPGFYDEWIGAERIRLQAAFELLMHRLLARLTEERRWRDAVRWGTHWFAHGESGEAACRALMTANQALGNLDGVRAAYRLCSQHLAREMGIEPSHETRALFERLVHTQPTHAIAPVALERPFVPDAQTRMFALLVENHWRVRGFMQFDVLPGPMR